MAVTRLRGGCEGCGDGVRCVDESCEVAAREGGCEG